MTKRLSKSGTPAPCRVLAVAGVGLFTAALASPAMAYVGPGAGLGILGALLAILLAVLATVVGLVLWPLRLLARRRKSARVAAEGPQSGDSNH